MIAEEVGLDDGVTILEQLGLIPRESRATRRGVEHLRDPAGRLTLENRRVSTRSGRA
jgi:hypothetical protein